MHIDINLFESQLASLANIASNFLIAGQEATRQGTSHPSIVPYQVFKTKDSFAMIGAGNDGQFRKFSSLLNRSDWSSHPDYSTNTSRVANRSILVPLIEEVLSKETTAYWLEKFKGGGFPFAPVNNIRQTFEHEHTVARGMVKEMEHPRAGKIKLVAPAVQYNGERMEVRFLLFSSRLRVLTPFLLFLQLTRPPPVLRQHSVEVLRELGLGDEEIVDLQSKSVV